MRCAAIFVGMCRERSILALRFAMYGPRAIRAASQSFISARMVAAEDISYGWLREASNRLANTLKTAGVSRGDRVAILLPQAPEVAAIHIAVYKLAAVALPLAVLFGVDAISYRLKDAGAKAVITNAAGLENSRPCVPICRTSNLFCRWTVWARVQPIFTRPLRARRISSIRLPRSPMMPR